MKLKEIKPGMAIHCSTIEEAKSLIELTNSEPAFLESWGDMEEKTCYRMDNRKIDGFSSAFYYKKNGCEIVEFTDLIIPELTLEEVLQICTEICEGRECDDCPMRGGDCFKNPDSDKSEIVKICEQWKSDHEKKEPEVEWVYRVFGTENFEEKFFETEEEAIERCEELAKTQKTKKYARYERVCRVKAV